MSQRGVKMKKHLLAAAVAGLTALNASAISIAVDIVSVVDESGSMGGEHAWIDDAILALETELVATAAGDPLSSNYGLVGFGGPGAGNPVEYAVGGNQFGTANEFATSANANLSAGGGIEDGYEAMQYVYDNYTFNANHARNIILVTDEDRDVATSPNPSINFNQMLNEFTSTNSLLNAVVNCTFRDGNGNRAIGIDGDGNAYVADGAGGYTVEAGGVQSGRCSGSTNNDYVTLATTTGGAAWDLNLLRAGGLTADSFTAAFVDIKVSEIINQTPPTVSEPGTLAIIGLGLFGFGVARARRNKKA